MSESNVENADSPAAADLQSVGASSGSRPYVGGQAVIEGVMMRSPQRISVVVRRADGSLSVHERACVSAAAGIWRWPFFRGVGALVESVRLTRSIHPTWLIYYEALIDLLSRTSGADLGSIGLP